MLEKLDTLLHQIFMHLYDVLPETVVENIWKYTGASWVCNRYDATMTEEDDE